MLIVMAGLPGAGKSTVAAALGQHLRAAVLSVDPIEAALWRSEISRDQPTGLAAYVVAEDLAREQLLLGLPVIVDAVNDAVEARGQWVGLAGELGCRLLWVEVFCSDAGVHRARLEGRRRGLVDFPEPSWESVQHRAANLAAWTANRLRLDSMLPVEVNVAAALRQVELTDDERAPARGA